MADPTHPHEDDRIEELLSQLQGIFGKLSHSEEEESRQKVDAPTPSPEPPKEVPPPVPAAPPAEPPPLDMPGTPAPPVEAAPPPDVTATTEPPAPPPVGADMSHVYTALFYPAGREAQAKLLAEKLQTLTPKFTKVTFQLNVTVYLPYDPKSEWKENVLASLGNGDIRTLFMIVERPLEEIRRKPLLAELEARKIYFQEVPLISIEKKAFYTDLLLGLVFFFDSQKPPTSEGQT